MTAQIIKFEDGAAAKFPFELKDAFRKAFPSATWNAMDKEWEVGSSSVKHLEQWIGGVNASGIVKEIAARDEADMNKKEIEELKAEIARVRSDNIRQRSAQKKAIKAKFRAEELRAKLIEEISVRDGVDIITNAEISRIRDEIARDSATEAKLRAEKLRARLTAEKEALDEAKKSKEAARSEADAVRQDVEKLIAHIATREKIEALREEMKANWIMNSCARMKFYDAQDALSDIFDALEKLGVECCAVTLAANASFHKKERDLGNLYAAIEFVAA